MILSNNLYNNFLILLKMNGLNCVENNMLMHGIKGVNMRLNYIKM